MCSKTHLPAEKATRLESAQALSLLADVHSTAVWIL